MPAQFRPPVAAALAVLGALFLAPTADGQTTTWTQTAAGTYNWPVAGHWTNGIPSGATADARLTAALSGNVRIDMFPDTTVNRLDIGDSQFTYTLQSANRYNLTFAPNGTVLPTLNMTAGSVGQTLSVELALGGHLSVTQNSTAGTLTLSGGIEQGNGHAITFAGAGTTAFSGSGNNLGAITKNGAGRLLLGAITAPSGTGPTGTGAVTVNGGTFELNDNRTFSPDVNSTGAGFFASGRDFTVNSGGALQLNGNWVTGNGYANSYRVSGTGAITGSADFNYINDLTMTGGTIAADGIRAGYFNAGTPTWRLGSGSLISSVVDLVNGVGSAGNQAALVIDVTGGTLTAADSTITGVIRNQDGRTDLGAGTFVKRGDGILVLRGDNTYSGGTTVERGTLHLAHLRAMGTGTTTITPTGGTAAVLLGANVPGEITTPFVVNAGTGTAVIGTGSAGVGTGFYSGRIALNGPVTLQAGNPEGTRFSGQVTGTGDVTITSPVAGGRQVIWLPRPSAVGPNNFVGNVLIDSNATLHLGSGFSPLADQLVPNGSNVSFLPGSRLELQSEGTGGFESVNALRSVPAGTSGDGVVETVGGSSSHLFTLTVGAGNGSGRFNGRLQEATGQMQLALVKAGTGTQTFSAPNTHTGGTTIDQGALLVTNTIGSGTGTGRLTVNAGGTFGGTGQIAPQGVAAPLPVLLNGGTVRPGGTDARAPVPTDRLTVLEGLTFDGAATLQSTVGLNPGPDASRIVLLSRFDRDTAGAATDRMTIRLTNDGTLNLSGAWQYTVPVLTYSNLGPGLTPFTNEANPTHFAVVADNFTFSGTPLVTLNNGGLSVTFVPVPEPGTVLAVAAAGLAAVRLRRRAAGRLS